jgi:hypothetical protein
MITKAIIEQVLDKHTVRIRIPILDNVIDSSTGSSIENCQTATECTLPNFSYNFKVGDIVFVDFEENNLDSPVVIGYLTNVSKQKTDGELLSITVESDALLPKDTEIGNVKKEEIECLSGTTNNIQNDIDSISNNNFSTDLKKINEKTESLQSKLNDAYKTFLSLTDNCETISHTVLENNSSFYNKIQDVFNSLGNLYKKIGNTNSSQSISDLILELENKVSELENSYSKGYIPVSQTTTESLNESYSTLHQCIMYDSYNYKYPKYKDMNPVGVLIHSTDYGNPNLKRYIQPSKKDKNYKYLTNLIGENKDKNDFNSSNLYNTEGFNAWVGKLADGSIASVQTLPWTWRANGCGDGPKGSCNDGWLQIEICDDGYKENKGNKTYFDKAYNEVIKLTAYLCKKFNIDPKGTVNYMGISVPTILCHKDSNRLELGSYHEDVYAWFNKYKKNMTNVRDDVQNLLNSVQN